MKKTSKILSIFLAVCAVLTMLSFSAAAVQIEIVGGSSMDTAKNVPSYGVSYVGTLEKGSLENWFKFTTTSAGKYTVFIKNYNIPMGGGNRLWIEIYDKYYQMLGDAGYMAPGTSENVGVELEANVTYYFKVHSGLEGNYEFKVTAPASSTKTLSSISVTKPTKTTYEIGDSLNTAGMVVTAKYSDGTSQAVTGYTLSGFNSSSAGNKTVTVSYTYSGVTKTATFSVTINEKQSGGSTGGETGGNAGGGSAVINNIINVINNIYVTIKNPILEFINIILDFMAKIF